MHFTFRSVLDFEQVFQGIDLCLDLLFACGCSVTPPPFVEKIIFVPLYYLATLSKIS